MLFALPTCRTLLTLYRISCKNFLGNLAQMVLLVASRLLLGATTKATRTAGVEVGILDHGQDNLLVVLLHGSAIDKNEVITTTEMADPHFHHGSKVAEAMPTADMEVVLVNQQQLHGNNNHLLDRTTVAMAVTLATMRRAVMVHLLQRLLLASALSCNNTVLL